MKKCGHVPTGLCSMVRFLAELAQVSTVHDCNNLPGSYRSVTTEQLVRFLQKCNNWPCSYRSV